MRRLLLLLLVPSGVLGGCQIGPVGANKPYWPVDTVRIGVPTGPVPVGARHVAMLVGYPDCTRQHPPVGWSVSDTTVVELTGPTCNQVGLVGKRPGRAELSVNVAGHTGSETVFVGSRPPIARIQVRPAFAWVGVGDTLRLTATPLDSLDRPLPATFLAWSLEDESIARFVGVPRVGELVVVAARPGRIKAYAELEGRSAATLIQIGAAVKAPEVTTVRIGWSSRGPAVGDTVAFQALVRGPEGTPLPGRRVVWSLTDPGILKLWSFVPMRSQRISYRAALPGTVLVRARSGAAEDTVRLVVPCPGPSPSPDRKSPMNRHH